MLKTLISTAIAEPQMSAKTLSEYNDASAIVRTSIIKDCKYKEPFIVARYNDAEEHICSDFEYALGFLEILKDQAKDLRKKSLDFEKMKREHALSCAEALEALFRMKSELVIFEKFTINTAIKKSRKMMLSGVKVSIRPEMTLSLDNGVTICGFIKLYFGKNKPLTSSIAENITCLGRYYFETVEKINFVNKYCFVIDVFANKIYHAPLSQKRNMSILSACCSEVFDRWEKI